MSKSPRVSDLNMQALAEQGTPLTGTSLLHHMQRLVIETHGSEPDLLIKWQAVAELRSGAEGSPDIWLHLQADTRVDLTCQRCMGAVPTFLAVNQWYRFVATEEMALQEDEQSAEDLLVMEPQFNLLALIEDELLMALPLVPMHEQCPVPIDWHSDIPEPGTSAEKPNPFAVLALLKNEK